VRNHHDEQLGGRRDVHQLRQRVVGRLRKHFEWHFERFDELFLR
jgi:hypothetical protein